MHKVFEQIRDHTEIVPLLQGMKINGTISEQERANVEATIRRSFENPLVRSWFSPEWETVRNEHDIVSPGESGTLRPDRVLIKGAEAVVIDYKFGTKKRKSYAVQIREYMQLLQRMGYRRVSGYIWYVEMEEIDQVS